MSDKIVDEHFWFTATTLGVNGFLISTEHFSVHPAAPILCSLLISAYAAILVVGRAAIYAELHKFQAPSDCVDPVALRRAETRYRLRRLPEDFTFVVAELSGAFFYFLLILLSFIGVFADWLSK